MRRRGECPVCGSKTCPWGGHYRPAASLVLAAVVLALCGTVAAGTASTHQPHPPVLYDAAQVTTAARTVPMPTPEVPR